MTSRQRKAPVMRAQRRRAEQQRIARVRGRTRIAVSAIVAVAVALLAMIVTKVAVSGDTTVAASATIDTFELEALEVPAAVLDTVGQGSVKSVPTRIAPTQPLSLDGKPLVLYIGAEYCPFCAAQRWALVVALNRFGKFTDLKPARSAMDDIHPGTATVTFYGATYTSPYLSFQGVELATSQRRGNRYQPLQTMTAQQAQVMKTFNAPPYVPANSAGAVPFIDFGNRFLMPGSGFSPNVLAGLSHSQIVTQLSEPDSAIAKAVNGSANAITATLCELTSGQPTAVCQSPAVNAFTEADHG